MSYSVFLFVFCVIVGVSGEATTQTESLTSSPSTYSKWEELMPALQSIKSTSKMKKERLFNVVKIIKFLLSDELNKEDAAKALEKFKEKFENSREMEENDNIPKTFKDNIKDPEDMFQGAMPDFDTIVEERLKAIKDIIDDRNYMLDAKEVKNNTATVKEEKVPAKNKTADFSRILSKIASALAKLKEQNQSSESQTPAMVPIFRSRNGCKNDISSPYENPKQLGNSVNSQTGINPMSRQSMFNIPCQRASDILEETGNFQLPVEAFCDNPAVDLKSLAKNTKLNLDNLPFKNIVPNSIRCIDSDESIAILFKPKTISLMQVYGNLLKKITMTVLVPYYVSKLAF